MDKDLLTTQLRIVKTLRPGQIHDFTIEGAATLKAFLAARENATTMSPAEKVLHRKIKIHLRAWESANPSCPVSQKPGQQSPRTQLALREAIDKVQEDRLHEISKDEIKLLLGAHDAHSRRVANGAVSDTRLRDLLETVLSKIAAYQRDTNGSADHSVFESYAVGKDIIDDETIRNEVVAATDFDDIPRSPVSILEEVEVDLHVRVFEYTGNTSIEGDIPQDVLVRVSHGNITVHGFVSGVVVASGSITIEGNIQNGILIADEGEISVERILIGSVVIAKKGGITCHHLEAPETTFAWDHLHVLGPILGGKLTAGSIDVEGKVVGAELSSCGKVTVDSIETGSKNPTTVYLRGTITCEDYGRTLGGHHAKLRNEANDLADKIRTAEEMDRLTHHQIHNAHRTSLFYLLGGTENATTAMSLQGLQTTSLNLRQILSLADSAAKFYQAAYDDPDGTAAERAAAFNEELIENVKIIKQGIEILPDEFGSAHKRYLLDRSDEFIALLKQLLRHYELSDSSDFLDNTVLRIVSEWHGTLLETDQETDQIVSLMNLDDAVLARINNEPETLQDMVAATLKEKEQSIDQRDRQRAESPIIRLLGKSAERYARNIEANHRRVVELRAEQKAAKTELMDEALVRYGDAAAGSCMLKARRYDPETIITASPFMRTGKDSSMAKTIVLENSTDVPTEFWLKGKLIQKII
jgi:Flagellar Assembly Protein A beta solenoid domain